MSDSIKPNTRRRVGPSAIRTANLARAGATMNPTTPTMPERRQHQHEHRRRRPRRWTPKSDRRCFSRRRSCPVTMPGNTTPGSGSTPNSRSASPAPDFSFGSSPGAPRAMRYTVGSECLRHRQQDLQPRRRQLRRREVRGHAHDRELLFACSSSVTVTRSPIASVPGNSYVGERFGNHGHGCGHHCDPRP